jgi:quercetin dioxygenase-like cupin family protein
MHRGLQRVAAVVMMGIVLSIQGSAPASHAQQATPDSGSPAVITSEVLGHAVPVAIEDPELALGRVTIMPGAAIPTHDHPGTQIGVVVQGALTYQVFTGEVLWYRSDDPAGEPVSIGPGETVVVRPGDALVETPGAIHQGRNAGDVPVVIYLSTLFPVGAPRSSVVDATPAP